MKRFLLAVLVLFTSVNTYAVDYEQEINKALAKHGQKIENISNEQLRLIVDLFNKELKKVKANENLSLEQKNMLKQSYIYLKQQKITDPVLKQARDKAVRTIEKSGLLK